MLDNKCYLFQDSLAADATAAKKWCREMGGSLVSIKSIEENGFVGKRSTAALTWIDVSDAESERNFTVGVDQQSKEGGQQREKPRFLNWGPGFPSGAGDYVVMYPNRYWMAWTEVNPVHNIQYFRILIRNAL
jgi:hypothetical protein